MVYNWDSNDLIKTDILVSWWISLHVAHKFATEKVEIETQDPETLSFEGKWFGFN